MSPEGGTGTYQPQKGRSFGQNVPFRDIFMALTLILITYMHANHVQYYDTFFARLIHILGLMKSCMTQRHFVTTKNVIHNYK